MFQRNNLVCRWIVHYLLCNKKGSSSNANSLPLCLVLYPPTRTRVLIHFSSNTADAALTILQGLDDKPLTDKLADDFIKWMADLAENSIENDDHMKGVSICLIKMKNRTLWMPTSCFSKWIMKRSRIPDWGKTRSAASTSQNHLSVRFYLTIIHRSGGKYPPLSPTLRWIIVLVYTTQAE